MIWQDLKKAQRVELILEFWHENCSAETLAKAISKHTESKVSRDAIIGIYNRNKDIRITHPLGGRGQPGNRQLRAPDGSPLPREHAPPRRGKLEKLADTAVIEKPVPIRKGAVVKISEEGREYDARSRKVPLHKVGANQCHWPVNDPEPGEQHLFCGREAAEERRYCSHHQGRSVLRPKPHQG